MNGKVLFVLLIILIAAGVGIYFYLENAKKVKAEEEAAAAEAATLAAATAEANAAAAATAAALEVSESTETAPPSHPLVGQQFLIKQSDPVSVIMPVEAGKKFQLDTSGQRNEKMVIVFEAVDGQSDTYYMYSEFLGKYIKYSNNGFGFRATKPTSNQYQIKFNKVNDTYVMSFVNSDGETLYFGVDTETNTIVTNKNVTTIIAGGGSVSVATAGVSGYIIPGNFGEDPDNYMEYGVNDDGEKFASLQGCKDGLGDVDLTDEQRLNALSIYYNEAAESPCSVYGQSDTYDYDGEATGWVSACVDGTKDVRQGCIL